MSDGGAESAPPSFRVFDSGRLIDPNAGRYSAASNPWLGIRLRLAGFAIFDASRLLSRLTFERLPAAFPGVPAPARSTQPGDAIGAKLRTSSR